MLSDETIDLVLHDGVPPHAGHHSHSHSRFQQQHQQQQQQHLQQQHVVHKHSSHSHHSQQNGHHHHHSHHSSSSHRRWSDPTSPPSSSSFPPSPFSSHPLGTKPDESQEEHKALSDSDSSSSSPSSRAVSPLHDDEKLLPPAATVTEEDDPPAAAAVAPEEDEEQREEVHERLEDGERGSGSDGSVDADGDGRVIKRVKVYSLNDAGAWADKGTGHVSVVHPGDVSMTIVVKAEEEGATVPSSSTPLTLLHHKIVDGQDYQRQGETIITWCELSTGLDLALSFQDSDGCGHVWQLITTLQASCEARLVVPERMSLEADEEAQLTLPAPSLQALPDIAGKLSLMSPAQKEYIATMLREKGEQTAYIPQLFALHRDCERRYEAALAVLEAAGAAAEREELAEQERVSCLQWLEQLFLIGKNLFLLNDAAVIEWLVAEDNMTATVAMLEYDPAYSAPPSASTASMVPPAPARHDYHHHRRFLGSTSFLTFSSLSSDPQLPAKIRQSYYLGYVKDVLLLRHLDDGALSTLSSMLFLNSVLLISRMNERRDWMTEVMTMMRHSMDTPAATSLHPSAAATTQPTSPLSATSSATSSASTSPVSDALSPSAAPMRYQEASVSPSPLVLSLSTHSSGAIRRHIFSFLQELLVLAKTVQVPLRDAFYRALVENGLIAVIEDAMARVWREEEEQKRQRRGRGRRGARSRAAMEREKEREKDERQNMWLWIICTDMVTNLLMHDATIIRSYVLSSSSSSAPSSLLSVIFSTLQSPYLYLGMGHTLSCIVRLLLDPEVLTTALDDEQGSGYLDLVYAQHLPAVLNALRTPTSLAASSSAYHVIELLSFCVLQHPSHFPAFAAAHSVFPRVHAFFAAATRTDVLCSLVRFVRTCLATKEPYYQQQLISPESPILQLCFRLFYANQRYNLLNSSLIDLFLLVRNEALTTVMDWMVEAEGERLERLTYVSVFHDLRKNWAWFQQQQRDRDAARTSTGTEGADGAEGVQPQGHAEDDGVVAGRETGGGPGGAQALEDGEETEPGDTVDEGALREMEDDVHTSGSSSDDERAVISNGDDSHGAALIARAVNPRKRRSSGLDSPPSPGQTSVTSSSTSPLSIIITKSPTFSSSPSSPPLTFSLSRVPLHSSSSPGSPPLGALPSSPQSPQSHLQRSRSPPPPSLIGSPLRTARSLGGRGDGEGSPGGGGGGGGGDETDPKRRKTASF